MSSEHSNLISPMRGGDYNAFSFSNPLSQLTCPADDDNCESLKSKYEREAKLCVGYNCGQKGGDLLAFGMNNEGEPAEVPAEVPVEAPVEVETKEVAAPAEAPAAAPAAAPAEAPVAAPAEVQQGGYNPNVDYKHKYLKYRAKYLALANGRK